MGSVGSGVENHEVYLRGSLSAPARPRRSVTLQKNGEFRGETGGAAQNTGTGATPRAAFCWKNAHFRVPAASIRSKLRI